MNTEPLVALLTRQQAQVFLQVSRPTLMRYVREGKLKAIRLDGGEYRFRREALEEFLALGEQKGAEA